MKAFSFEEQAALLEASVCIVGLGGLGGIVCEILARMGVGTLGLIDGDAFDESNLNRQFLSTEDRIGASKTKAALIRVKSINSSITAFGYHEFLDETKAVQRIRPFTVVADCLDNIRTRFELERAAKSACIPLVSGAVSGAAGQVTVIFPEDAGFQSIYGKAEKSPVKGSETTLGCLPFAVTLIASIECSEIAKIILKKGSHFRNKLFVAELMDNVFEIFQL
ncbi:MAG: hypothetical protein A2V65_05910 [Deltaproteobacteria bacterium RBG_13_49_15]|nr:MAG: hypothetical protein A2V65_05910 [Deltaproteobacteria bacterium RBG_13_49_15]